MTSRVIFILGLLFILLATAPVRANSPRLFDTDDSDHSLYVWDSRTVVGSAEKTRQLLSLCRSNGIDRIYLFLSRRGKKGYLQRRTDVYQRFLRKSQNLGIEVYGLIGNKHWVKPAYHAEARRILDTLFTFQREQPEGAAEFQGVMLDVEPHALTGWYPNTRRARLARNYLDLLSQVRSTLDSHESDLRMTVSIPHSYRGIRVDGRRLNREIYRIVDEVTVMSYFDEAGEVIKHARPMVDLGQSMDVPVEVAVEMNTTSPVKHSFAGSNVTSVREALTRIQGTLVPRSGFDGLALHDFNGLVKMTDG